jgi:hypothetical protein
MLSTDAYAFLNITDPLCAWATYRGKLVCAPSEPGFLSVWTAGTMRADNPARIDREFKLEHTRLAQFPDRISRLRGMFCFLDIASAEHACASWASSADHFRAEYLAELHLGEAGPKRDRLDSNWITHAPENEEGFLTGIAWIPSYWAGEPYPNATPIWETLVEGRMIVLGTSLREQAYAAIKRRFPDSLTLLEIARQAAWVGSDLGNICAWLRQDGAALVLKYYMDMRDAENPDVLGALEQLKRSGHPINWADMAPHIAQDSFGRVPDLRPFGFRRHRVGMQYVDGSNQLAL